MRALLLALALLVPGILSPWLLPPWLSIGAGWAQTQSPAPSSSLPGIARPGPGGGDGVVRTERTRSRLVPAQAFAVPGQRLRVGLHQVFDPGWHSYWINPGDSGFAATLSWRLPPDAVAGPTLWPAPARKSFGTLTNFGFADSVVLLADIDVPAGLAPGARFDIGLSASWLVCAEICIPEEGIFSLALPVAASSAPGPEARLLDDAAAALPTPSPWSSSYARDGGRLRLRQDGAEFARIALDDAYFFPIATELIDHSAPQRRAVDAGGMTVEIVLTAAGATRALDRLDGVLVLSASGRAAANAYALAAAPGQVAALPPAASAPVAGLTLLEALALALLGGVILNLMPCVFPVLSMKALALASLQAADRGARRREGLAYGAGVLSCFALLAAAMAGLRLAGGEFGWGVQFQSPGFVAAMALVMLAVGLNLSGVFALDALRPALPGVARGGGIGSFLTGALAVLVATPCTAPFMAAAMGMAMAADIATMAIVVMALGLGFAAPFVLLSLLPGLGRLLPRPGAWMVRLRGALAFPMYGTCAWLVWVLSQQVGPAGLALALAALVALGFAAWLFGDEATSGAALRRVAAAAIAALALLAAAAVGTAPGAGAVAGQGGGPGAGQVGSKGRAAGASSGLVAEAFSQQRLADLRRDGRPVFVNMTAAWCITCLFNEANALASAEAGALFAAGGVVYLKGDWTRQDPEITRYLREFGRSGVPLYVYYPPAGGAPEILPQLLDAGILARAFGRR